MKQEPDISEEPENLPPEDPRFRLIRRLVTALLVVMIGGILTVVIAFVMKLKDLDSPKRFARAESERILRVEATQERVSITLRDDQTGAERVILLDGRSFAPLTDLRPAQ